MIRLFCKLSSEVWYTGGILKDTFVLRAITKARRIVGTPITVSKPSYPAGKHFTRMVNLHYLALLQCYVVLHEVQERKHINLSKIHFHLGIVKRQSFKAFIAGFLFTSQVLPRAQRLYFFFKINVCLVISECDASCTLESLLEILKTPGVYLQILVQYNFIL